MRPGQVEKLSEQIGEKMSEKTMRSFRIPDDVYSAARDECERNGITLTELVTNALIEYAKK